MGETAVPLPLLPCITTAGSSGQNSVEAGGPVRNERRESNLPPNRVRQWHKGILVSFGLGGAICEGNPYLTSAK